MHLARVLRIARQALAEIEKLDKLIPAEASSSGGLPNLLACARKSIVTGATTVLECGLLACTKLTGLQKKRNAAAAAATWASMMADIADTTDPSSVVHPALREVLLSVGPK